MYSVEIAISAWLVQRDQAAAAWLVHEHRGLVLGTARRWGVPLEMEQDAVQEVFVRVFNRLHLFRPDKPFVHWLSVIARNTCAKLRRYWCHRSCLSAVFEQAAQDVSGLDVPHLSSPDKEVAAREWMGTFQHALAALPPHELDLFERIVLGGEDVASSMVRLGTTSGAIRVTLHRVRRKLQTSLSLHLGV